MYVWVFELWQSVAMARMGIAKSTLAPRSRIFPPNLETGSWLAQA